MAGFDRISHISYLRSRPSSSALTALACSYQPREQAPEYDQTALVRRATDHASLP
jgi:hypothetical protein